MEQVKQDFQVISSYSDLTKLQSFKGITHSHIQEEFPTTIEAREICKKGDYDFFAITDHDLWFPALPWTDDDWEAAKSNDFLIIRGFEISHPIGHICCLGCLPWELDLNVDTLYKNKWEEANLPVSFDSTLKLAKEKGAFLCVNHPAKWIGYTEELLAKKDIDLVDAIEIYNGVRVARPGKVGYVPELYDDLLTQGYNYSLVVSPDCHSWDIEADDSPYNGHSVVYAEELSQKSIIEALNLGRFYGTTGLEFNDIEVTDKGVRVSLPFECNISFIGQNGEVLKKAQDNEAYYMFTGTEGYVRVEAESSKLHVWGGENCPDKAWLQPIWIKQL